MDWAGVHVAEGFPTLKLLVSHSNSCMTGARSEKNFLYFSYSLDENNKNFVENLWFVNVSCSLEPKMATSAPTFFDTAAGIVTWDFRIMKKNVFAGKKLNRMKVLKGEGTWVRNILKNQKIPREKEEIFFSSALLMQDWAARCSSEMERYTVTGRIGEGAHGVVLKATNNDNGQEVALKKVLLKRIEDGIPTSIIREVKTLQELKHPYVSSKQRKTFIVSLPSPNYRWFNFRW